MRLESGRLSEDGSVLLPEEFRAALGLQPRDELLIRLDDNEIRLCSRESGVRWARYKLSQGWEERTSLVEALFAERRAEAIGEWCE